MPDGYKMRYARNIWQQFEDNIRSASHTTATLPRFFEILSRRLAISLRADDKAGAVGLLTGGEDKQILRALRSETTTLVLMTRLKNDERREQIKKEKETDENDTVGRSGNSPLFDLA